ncbi:putative hexaprenyldihydroxybenzoate methyltransferase [Hibiscus syriacus]|uniref:Hexaprenyldihydroxybenzoate methyltransferase n=1 Tax=Hibiscus syriacus TaxID=106335 RepID=A0A6A3CHY0_HIBSY|nr:putative hexaprenyldihydroxybenzoate methyltransferase [Hibiscus syriacus]
MFDHKSKLARTFQRVVNLRTATKIASSNGIGNSSHGGFDVNRRGDALAMVFVSVTSIKTAYAKLQMAQNPYNSDAIQAAEQAVMEQLKVLSELKHKFLKHELDVSPQVSLMHAKIQEQQSLMRTDEINIKKLEYDIERKVADIALNQ